MISLKFADRAAVFAMLSVSVAVPLASLAVDAQAAPLYSTAHVVTDDTIQGVRAGMTTADVLATIGSPSRKMRFEATKTTAWDYHYQDAWGYSADFSVILDDAGIVVGKVSVRNGQ